MENFLDKTLLVLDIQESSLVEILTLMLRKVKDTKDGEYFSTDDALESMFSHQSGTDDFLGNACLGKVIFWLISIFLVTIKNNIK